MEDFFIDADFKYSHADPTLMAIFKPFSDVIFGFNWVEKVDTDPRAKTSYDTT